MGGDLGGDWGTAPSKLEVGDGPYATVLPIFGIVLRDAREKYEVTKER